MSNEDLIAQEPLEPCRYISPVPSEKLTEALLRDWPVIMAKVLAILDNYAFTQSKVVSVSLFNMGFSQDFDTNSPTLCISIDQEPEEPKWEWWTPIMEEIKQLLRRYPYNLGIYMDNNNPRDSKYPDFPLIEAPEEGDDGLESEPRLELGHDPYRKYKTRVDLGEDIGAGGYFRRGPYTRAPSIGTLGCWIEIKTLEEPRWKKYALTNYHVVRPAFDGLDISGMPPVKDSDLWNADIKGVNPSFMSKTLTADIEHPTRAKHHFAVEVLASDIEDEGPNASSDLKEHLDNILSFFNNGEQHFGTVSWASGYTRRTASNGRLDWALIKPTGVHRIGRNTLPSRADWHQRGYITSRPRDRGHLQQPPAGGLGSLGNGTPMFKVGTVTGPTAGLFSGSKGKVRIEEDKHVQYYMRSLQGRSCSLSDEFLFMGFPVPAEHWIAMNGDSGSVVFNSDGAAVGLLLTGGRRLTHGVSSYAYITPIEDVFADIKAFSNGQITDIRIAEDQ